MSYKKCASWCIAVIAIVIPTSIAHAQYVPSELLYEGRLLTSTGVSITTPHTFRLSFWKSADWTTTDTTSTGALHTASAQYGGWTELQTITPNSNGTFSLQLGSQTSIASVVYQNHKYLQVEIKPVGEADTNYQIMDPTGDNGSDTVDRKFLASVPYAKNADRLRNRIIGSSSGELLLLSSGSAIQIQGGLTINKDNAAQDAVLNFGNNLAVETLKFVESTHRFEFSDDVHITQNLSASGSVSVGGAARFQSSVDVNGHTSMASSGVTIFNEQGQAVNVRIESDNDANMFFVHGTNDRVGIKTSSPETTLEIVGTASGRVLHAQDALSTSGSLVGATIAGFNLSNCTLSTDKLLYNATTKVFSCGTDQTGTAGLSSSTADTRYLRLSGGTLTGTLIITHATSISASGSIATETNITINKDNAAQDAVLNFGNNLAVETLKFVESTHRFEFSDDVHITQNLSASGSVSVGGAARFQSSVNVQGTLSGSTLAGAGLTDCNNATNDKLLWDETTKTFSCGTDQTGGGGGGIATVDADARYVRTSGDTMTGALTISNGAGLTTSGSIATETNITINKDNAAQDAVLNFGNNLAVETLKFVESTHRFEFSDDVHITQNLSASGSVSIEGLATMSGIILKGKPVLQTNLEPQEFVVSCDVVSVLSIEIPSGCYQWIPFPLPFNSVPTTVQITSGSGIGQASGLTVNMKKRTGFLAEWSCGTSVGQCGFLNASYTVSQ